MQIISRAFSKRWPEHKLRYATLKLRSNSIIEEKSNYETAQKCFLLGFSSVLNYFVEAAVHCLHGKRNFWPSFSIFRRGDYYFVSAFSSSFRNFFSSIFRYSSNSAPTVTCSAAIPDLNDVHVRTGPLAGWMGSKYIEMRLTVLCFEMTMETFSAFLIHPSHPWQYFECFQMWNSPLHVCGHL